MLLATFCAPSSASACCFFPLPWHCGWSWSPFDPCGVYSSNCSTGHCGLRGLRGQHLAAARYRQQVRRVRTANRRAVALNRRTGRVCERCARLQNQAAQAGGCSCGESVGVAMGPGPAIFGAGMAPAMFGAGVGTIAAGPVPVTTQVPVTTYRTVTVDQGSYQRVWVPRLVTQRVPQTTYQNRTVWMNQPQPQAVCDPGLPAAAPFAPSTTLPGSVLPGTQPLPSTIGPAMPSYSVPIDGGLPIDTGLPLGSPYGGNGIQFEDSLAPPPIPDGAINSGSVPLPPVVSPTTSLIRPMRSASTLGIASGVYSDGIRHYDPAHVTAPGLPRLSAESTFPQLPSSSHSRIVGDRGLDDHFDDWVDVEPSASSRTASTRSTRVYEPSPYQRRTKSGLFSPVRPGSAAAARARFVGR